MRRTVPRPLSREDALQLMAGLCAKCEQCEADLRDKMRRRGLSATDADYVIDYLYEHNFLDMQRYANAYVRDKFRFNHWGRIKISIMLRSKRLPKYIIDNALAEISDKDYYEKILHLSQSMSRSLQLEDYNDRTKLIRRLYSRGFEPALIRTAIEELTTR